VAAVMPEFFCNKPDILILNETDIKVQIVDIDMFFEWKNSKAAVHIRRNQKLHTLALEIRK
jgi:hypothetical protein